MMTVVNHGTFKCTDVTFEEAKAIIEEERARMSASLNPGFNPFVTPESSVPPATTTPPGVGTSSLEPQLNVDDLVARIDKRIAELEADERREIEKTDAPKLDQVVDTIKSRRDELYQANATDSTEE